MTFSYKARTKDGELQIGNVDADNKDSAVNILLGHGLFVLNIHEIKEGGVGRRLGGFFRRVRLDDLMIFTRQFATLLEAEVSLSDSLENLYRQTVNPILKEALVDITNNVEAGHTLSQSLEAQGKIFSEFYVNMIKSAEITGRLSEVLNFLAEYLESQAALVSKVKNALSYPIFVFALFFVVIIIMTTFVLPQLAPIFEETKTELSLFTKIMLGGGQFFAKWWWALAFVFGLFILMLIDYLETSEGKIMRDELVLRIPFIGALFQKVYVARFAESAKVLIKGGLSIPQSIDISSRTIGNVVYEEALHQASEQVRKGRLLSQALSQMPVFPPLVSQLVAVGESTGRLDELLGKINKFYSREVNDIVENLTNILQPVLMVIIGAVVALLFASVLMPMYSMMQSFGAGGI